MVEGPLRKRFRKLFTNVFLKNLVSTFGYPYRFKDTKNTFGYDPALTQISFSQNRGVTAT